MREPLTIGPILEEALSEQEPHEDLEDVVFRVVSRRSPEEAASHASGVVALVRETAERERLTPEAAARRLASGGARPGGAVRTDVLTLVVTSVDGVPTEIAVTGVRRGRTDPHPVPEPALDTRSFETSELDAFLAGEEGAGPRSRTVLHLPEEPPAPAPAWMIGLLVVLVVALLGGACVLLMVSK